MLEKSKTKFIFVLTSLALFLLCLWIKAHANFNLDIVNEISIIPEILPKNSEMQAIRLINRTNKNIQIKDIIVPDDPSDHGLIKYEKIMPSSSLPTDTCKIGNYINSKDSCLLWFQAVAIGKLFIPKIFTVNVVTEEKIYRQNFKLTYQNNLYVGGRINIGPNNHAIGVAKWDGIQWTYLDGINLGSYDDTVMTLAYDNDSLYAGGSFNGRVAVTNISNKTTPWKFLPGLEDAAETLAVFDHELYAGGDFSGAYKLIPKTSSWLKVGKVNKSVRKYLVNASQLYAGGDFKEKLIKLGVDKDSWIELGANLEPDVNILTLTAVNNSLFVAGQMNSYKAYYEEDGIWMGIDDSAPYQDTIFSMITIDGKLYVGSYKGLFVLNDNLFQQLLPNDAENFWVKTILAVGETLYTGGNFAFKNSKGKTITLLAKYYKGNWTQIAPAFWNNNASDINSLITIPNWSITVEK